MGEHHAVPGPQVPGAGRQPGGAWRHTPVMLQRCLDLLSPALGGAHPTMLDATLGLGGHAESLLATHPRLTLIGLDRDPRALALANARLAPYAGRLHTAPAVFDQLRDVLDRFGVDTVDGVLFDLGVSSMQLDDPDRGFAYARDAALDMRMDSSGGVSAADVINSYPPADLVRVLRTYGEERFATRIVAAIVRERARGPITSTARLAELVRDAIPAATRRTGGHPAKRTFQALRIEVNGELAALSAALPAALDALAVGGRIVVLAYHSLEDRLVKRAFAERVRMNVPIELPMVPPGAGPSLRLLTRGAEQPDEAELAANPRAASARLRAAQRIDAQASTRRVAAMHQPGVPPGRRRDRHAAPGPEGTDKGEQR